MFNKKLIASITLDHRKFIQQEKDSCEIKILDTRGLLEDDEVDEIRNHLNNACDLLRKAYKKRMEIK